MTSGKKIWTRMENGTEQRDNLIPAKVLLTILYIRKRVVLNSMAVLRAKSCNPCAFLKQTMKQATLMAAYMTPPLFYFHNKPSEVEYTKG